jgi:hypothetical protein
MQRTALAAAASLLALGLAAPASAGKLTVGAGASFDVGTGILSLGCADLDVTGTFSAGTLGFGQARDVTINPGGVLNGDSATLSLAGDWDNAGTFNAGTSTVAMVDGCSLFGSVVSGNTSFSKLSLETTTAKQVSFAAGSTQTATGLFSIQGALGNRLVLRSTAGGSPAFLNATGGNTATFVDVDDIDATAGNDIFIPPNSVKGPNTPGWLLGIPVPLLGPIALGALALLLLGSGKRLLHRTTRADSAL